MSGMRLPAQLQQGARAARILPFSCMNEKASACKATWTQGKPAFAIPVGCTEGGMGGAGNSHLVCQPRVVSGRWGQAAPVAASHD